MSEEKLVTLKIDDKEVTVPEGTLIIRAAEKLGINIPRFCDHPLLKPVAACRQCLVEVSMPDREGNIRPMPKPQPSCAMTVVPNMQVRTQLTSQVALQAQRGVMEFVLLNHPLDCPICDKAGQCPLQDRSYQVGQTDSRFIDQKRKRLKPMQLTSQILLDRERCILCQRCVRFGKEITGDVFLDLQMRGSREEIGRFDTEALGFVDDHAGCSCDGALDASGPEGNYGLVTSGAVPRADLSDQEESGKRFASYFSGNIIDICPVGALTSASYRFKARPFDLVTHESVSEYDPSATEIQVDIRNNRVLRRNVSGNLEENKQWISDKDRFGYTWQNDAKRLRTPLVDGQVASYSDAFARVVDRLQTKVAFLPGGSLTLEDAYAWSKFARKVAGTNAIDHRYRRVGVNEQAFIYNNDFSKADLEKANTVVLVDFEPEEHAPSLFLTLYRRVNEAGTKVYSLNPYASFGAQKLGATMLEYSPSNKYGVLKEISADGKYSELYQLLQDENAVLLVGESAVDDLVSVAEFADTVKAQLAFVPRRIAEASAVYGGATPQLLANKITVTDSQAVSQLEQLWQCQMPEDNYNSYDEIFDAVLAGDIQTLVVGGVDVADYPDVEKARRAFEKAYVISLEVRRSEVSEKAQVVIPVAPPNEKNATFVSWQGEKKAFGQLFTSTFMSEAEVFNTISDIAQIPLNLASLTQIHAELAQVEQIEKTVDSLEYAPEKLVQELPEGQHYLSSYKMLIDDGLRTADLSSLQKSARKVFARVSAKTASTLGVKDSDYIKVSGASGQITLPVVVTEMSDDLVWLPQHSRNCHVYEMLGDVQTVTLVKAESPVALEEK